MNESDGAGRVAAHREAYYDGHALVIPDNGSNLAGDHDTGAVRLKLPEALEHSYEVIRVFGNLVEQNDVFGHARHDVPHLAVHVERA